MNDQIQQGKRVISISITTSIDFRKYPQHFSLKQQTTVASRLFRFVFKKERKKERLRVQNVGHHTSPSSPPQVLIQHISFPLHHKLSTF